MTKNLENIVKCDFITTLPQLLELALTKLFGFNLNIHSFSKVELTLYPLSVRLPKFLHVLDFTRAIYPALLHTAVVSNILFPKPFMFWSLMSKIQTTVSRPRSKYSINPHGGFLFYSFFYHRKVLVN